MNLEIYERTVIELLILVIIFFLRSLFIIFVNWYDYSIGFKLMSNSKNYFHPISSNHIFFTLITALQV